MACGQSYRPKGNVSLHNIRGSLPIPGFSLSPSLARKSLGCIMLHSCPPQPASGIPKIDTHLRDLVIFRPAKSFAPCRSPMRDQRPGLQDVVNDDAAKLQTPRPPAAGIAGFPGADAAVEIGSKEEYQIRATLGGLLIA